MFLMLIHVMLIIKDLEEKYHRYPQMPKSNHIIMQTVDL